jgi:hypothetical protein
MISAQFLDVPVFSACVRKTKFENRKRVDAFTRENIPLWTVRIMAPTLKFGALVDEMVTVSIAAAENPAKTIQRGAPVDFVNLMQGITQTRVVDGQAVGGNAYFVATGVQVLGGKSA